MKELSIEDKAKRYDEAIKFAHNKHRFSSNLSEIKLIEELFPELKESEDDKMREMAIKAVYAPEAQSCIKSWGINPDDVIVWLEKQGKQIEPIDGFSTEFERQISHLIASIINKEYEYTEAFVKWTSDVLLNYAKREIEKQGEQKPVEWSGEDENILEAITYTVKNSGYSHCIGISIKVMIDWLKSLKERMK